MSIEKIKKQFMDGVTIAMRGFDYPHWGLYREDIESEMMVYFQECLNRGDGKKLISPSGKEIKHPFRYAQIATDKLSWKWIQSPESRTGHVHEGLESLEQIETGDEEGHGEISYSRAPDYISVFDLQEKIISGADDVTEDFSLTDPYYKKKDIPKGKKIEGVEIIDGEKKLKKQTERLNLYKIYMGYKIPRRLSSVQVRIPPPALFFYVFP